MNIKDRLNPYTDTRKEDLRQGKLALKNKKAVYKCNYELVMGYIPNRLTKTITASRPSAPTRHSGGTLNGRAL